MPASPYPLGGEARDVVEDVRRLGGFGIVAHPDSPKPELRWREWTAPFDGIELLNPDTSWRVWADAGRGSGGVRVGAPAAPAGGARRLSVPAGGGDGQPDRSSRALRWSLGDAAAPRRDDRRRRCARQSRAAAAIRATPVRAAASGLRVVVPHACPSTSARPRVLRRRRRRRALVMRAHPRRAPLYRHRRRGDAAILRVHRHQQRGTVHEGDELPVAGPVTLHVRSNAPPGSRRRSGTAIGRCWAAITTSRTSPSTAPRSRPSTGWRFGPRRNTALTWLRSNPVYVRTVHRPPDAARRGGARSPGRSSTARRTAAGASNTIRRRSPPSTSHRRRRAGAAPAIRLRPRG